MSESAPATSSCMLPIGGMTWFWRDLEAGCVDEVLPLVLATDRSGSEAASWRRDARARLDSGSGGGVVITRCHVQCDAGLTLAFFFHARGEAPGGRSRLRVDRLRWLELGPPHRTLDALLAIVLRTAERFACADVLLDAGACVEWRARAALEQRAMVRGFRAGAGGWHLAIPAPCCPDLRLSGRRPPQPRGRPGRGH